MADTQPFQRRRELRQLAAGVTSVADVETMIEEQALRTEPSENTSVFMLRGGGEGRRGAGDPDPHLFTRPGDADVSQPPDLRPLLSPMTKGMRAQVPAVGAITIIDIGMADLLLAYPSAWASLEMMDPQRMADTSDGSMTLRAAIGVKQLLACALVREFGEPRQSEPVPAAEIPRAIFSDAQEMVARVLKSRDPDRLALILAGMFERELALTRRVVDALLQKDER